MGRPQFFNIIIPRNYEDPGIASALGANPSDKATLVMTGDHWEMNK
jgi:hypothetical protein